MEIEDLSIYCRQGQKYKNKNPLAPVWPFRLIAAGETGCGKTNMVINLLKYIHFDRLYVYAKMLDEALYELIDEVIYKKSNKVEDIPDIEEFDKTLQNVIIIDDMLQEDHTKIIDLHIRGRKQNISIIYITQSYFKTPKEVRLQSNYQCIYHVNSVREMRMLCDDKSGGMPYAEFKKYFTLATRGDNNFLVIDQRARDDHMKLRCGWDKTIIFS